MILLRFSALRSILTVLALMGALAFNGSPNAQAQTKPVTKYARFQSGGTIAYGIVEGDLIRQIDGDLFGSWKNTDKTYALSSVMLLVPTQPTQVLAMAGNFTGTPGNTAAIKPGDVVEIELEGDGVLKNAVAAGK